MWACKLCDSSLSSRYELIKHFRLRHFNHGSTCQYPCVYVECPCTFRTWKNLLSHIYRTHRKLETTDTRSTTFTCQTCGCKELSTESDYFSHTYQHLRQYENVTCMFEGCAFQTKIYGTFKSHKNRKHTPHRLSDFKAGIVKITVQSACTGDEPTSSADIDKCSDTDSDIDDSEDLPEILEKRLASVLLKLENIFHVPSTAVDELVEELHYLQGTVSVPLTCSSLLIFFKNKNIEIDAVILNELASLLCKSNPFVKALGKGGALATAYKRKEYFKKVLNVVEPVEYVLDKKKK